MMGKDIIDLTVKAISVIALAVIILAGIAITTQYSQTLRATTGVNVTGLVLLNGTAVRVGTSGQYPFLQTATSCVNTTNASLTLPVANYTVTEGTVLGGFITTTATFPNWTSTNCSITYLGDSGPQGVADNFTAGLAIFGTFIAIIILSLVGKVIVGIFRPKKD